MRSNDQIVLAIIEIVANLPACYLDAKDIKVTHLLREDLGLDSLAIVDLMVRVEDEFGIFFDPIQTDLTVVFETIETLANFVIFRKSKTQSDS